MSEIEVVLIDSEESTSDSDIPVKPTFDYINVVNSSCDRKLYCVILYFITVCVLMYWGVLCCIVYVLLYCICVVSLYFTLSYFIAIFVHLLNLLLARRLLRRSIRLQAPKLLFISKAPSTNRQAG